MTIKFYDHNGDEVEPFAMKRSALYRRLAAHISDAEDLNEVDEAVEEHFRRTDIRKFILKLYRDSTQFDYTTHTQATNYVRKQLKLAHPEYEFLLDEYLDWKKHVI